MKSAKGEDPRELKADAGVKIQPEYCIIRNRRGLADFAFKKRPY